MASDFYCGAGCNSSGEELIGLANITPKPSAVFSTSSSASALSSFDDDGSGDSDDATHDVGSCEEVYRGQQRGLNSILSTNRATSPHLTRNKEKPILYLWKHRMAELCFVHIILFVLITFYIQTSNRIEFQATIGVGTQSGVAATLTTTSNSTTLTSTDNKDCIYVPGGGFSGFWFSLGRLQSLENPQNEQFVCYSAGCLGVFSILWNQFENEINRSDDKNSQQYESLYENARAVQVEWQKGYLHRYRVVETFIDALLDPLVKADDSTSQAFLEIAHKTMHIATTVFDENASLIPKATMQRPKDVASLKRMLLQTTWIPLATGPSWTHKGHMDGAFSMIQHPHCRKKVGLATSVMVTTNRSSNTSMPPSLYESFEKSAILWTNVLNVNLNKRDVERLWSFGLEYGV